MTSPPRRSRRANGPDKAAAAATRLSRAAADQVAARTAEQLLPGGRLGALPLAPRIPASAVSTRAFPCFRTQAADQARATCTPGTARPAIRALRAHPRAGIITPVPMPSHHLDASSRSPSRSPPDSSHTAFSASLSTAVFSQGTMRRLDATPAGRRRRATKPSSRVQQASVIASYRGRLLSAHTAQNAVDLRKA